MLKDFMKRKNLLKANNDTSLTFPFFTSFDQKRLEPLGVMNDDKFPQILAHLTISPGLRRQPKRDSL
jgi:hypothetical protein